jgi:hypothetical protein
MLIHIHESEQDSKKLTKYCWYLLLIPNLTKIINSQEEKMGQVISKFADIT